MGYSPQCHRESDTTEVTKLNRLLGQFQKGVELGPVRYALFVKNAFDEAANYGDAPPLGAELPGRPRIAVSRPRTVGLELSARF